MTDFHPYNPVDADIEELNQWLKATACESLDLKITGYADGILKAEMPLDHRHVQSHRTVHGGISCVLAETVGSVLSNIMAAKDGKRSVGAEIHANHIKPASEGETLIAEGRMVHSGRSRHVVNIDIYNQSGELICVSRLSMAVLG